VPKVHPIERLRYVARSSGADQRVAVRETAIALRGLRLEPVGLVTACRRIVERHPSSGALWWLCAKALTAADPFAEVLALAEEVDDDPTPDHLYDALPADATVCVVGWPDLAGDALVRRGDLAVLAVDVQGEGSGFVRRLQRSDVEAEAVPPSGLGAAAASADLVLVEASCTGPDGLLAVTGSRAVAAVAYCAEIPVWAVVGIGRRLPTPLWRSVLERLDREADPWDLDDEVVPAGLISHVVGPHGICGGAADLARAECPVAQELTKIHA
jgi:hypothetical protein